MARRQEEVASLSAVPTAVDSWCSPMGILEVDALNSIQNMNKDGRDMAKLTILKTKFFSL